MTEATRGPVVLAVLDGWGIATKGASNAISQANLPNMSKFYASYPQAQLSASGESVGLPRGESGNTETGHLNLGAGRIVYQDLARINLAIAEGTFFKNNALVGAIDHVKKNSSTLHYMGLLGSGGVHSNAEHLYALLQLAAQNQIQKLFIHIFTDGRDSPPNAARTYISQLRQVMEREGVGQIASVMGRYWAMDRDLRWDRTERAYRALTEGVGNKVKTPEEAVDMSYSQGKTDEFIEPSLVSSSEGNPIGLVGDNDAVVFFNFRIDRPRQLTKAFISKDFSKSNLEWDFDPHAVKYEKTHLANKPAEVGSIFERKKVLSNLYFATMTEYGKPLTNEGVVPAFPPEPVQMPLGRVLAENDLKQLRISESEKERFVTFYFNGQQESAFPGEDRAIIPSPKVATYDAKPEMSAYETTEKLLESLRGGENNYSFILINYANPDMVGHTGNIGPAVRACEVVDECLGKIANHILAYGGTLLITADHGNVEEMIDGQTGEITPTVLGQLNIKAPDAMTGRDLLAGINS